MGGESRRGSFTWQLAAEQERVALIGEPYNATLINIIWDMLYLCGILLRINYACKIHATYKCSGCSRSEFLLPLMYCMGHQGS